MRAEVLRDMVFEGAVVVSVNDQQAKHIMEKGTSIAVIYNITAPDCVNFRVYRVDGKTFIIDFENYAE